MSHQDARTTSPEHSTTDMVEAIPAGRSWRFRSTRAREFFRTRFWALPTLFLAAAVVSALGLETFVRASGVADQPSGSADSATTVLSVVATAMLTFVGVVFTITLVALQLASSQLSPRVLRTFVRSIVTKAAFGIFLSTFTFSLLTLAQLPTFGPEATHLAVAITLGLVMASLVVFLMYVTATVNLLQVSRVIGAVANETRSAISKNYLDAEQYRPAAAARRVDSPAMVGVGEPRRRRQLFRVHGVLLGIDKAHLVRLARTHDCVIEMLVRIGDYVPGGTTVLAVHGGSVPKQFDLLRALQFGRERTLYQDPFYGFRELVDVAAQALSPAVNQPTTAIQVIDRLEDLLLRVGYAPDPAGAYADDDGTVRLLVRARTWHDLVDLSFTEIEAYGARSPAVTRRLASAIDMLVDRLPPERHADLVDQRASLVEQVTHQVPDTHQRVVALTPDSMGLG